MTEEPLQADDGDLLGAAGALQPVCGEAVAEGVAAGLFGDAGGADGAAEEVWRCTRNFAAHARYTLMVLRLFRCMIIASRMIFSASPFCMVHLLSGYTAIVAG